MPDYTITPESAPSWSLEAEDFAERIRKRWPDARVGVDQLPKSPMVVEALIPYEPPRRNLGVALNRRGNMVLLDPAEPESAAEFILWYVEQIPEFDPPVYVFTEQYEKSPALRPGITAEELLSFLDR